MDFKETARKIPPQTGAIDAGCMQGPPQISCPASIPGGPDAEGGGSEKGFIKSDLASKHCAENFRQA